MTIGNQPTDHIDEKIGWTPMATVFDLRDVFELVIDRFDDDPFAQEPLVRARDQAVFHIPLDGGKQLDPVSKELLKHPLGEIAFVAQQFPKESLRQASVQVEALPASYAPAVPPP